MVLRRSWSLVRADPEQAGCHLCRCYGTHGVCVGIGIEVQAAFWCVLLTRVLWFSAQPACEPGHGQDRVQLGHSPGLENPRDRGSL